MAQVKRCDICKKEVDEIEAKIFLTPFNNGQTARTFHHRYSHHADVCGPCLTRVLKSFDWTKRKTREEYQKSRKKAPK